MTTLIAYQGDEWVVLASDRKSSDEDGFTTYMEDSKVFKNGPIVMSGAGQVRGINIMQHDFTPPAVGNTRDADKYITSRLIPAMRKAFQDANYEYVKPESSIENDNIWIVVVSRKVYRINEDYGWERSNENLYAAGSGEKFALGAAEALTDGKPIDSIEQAKEVLTKAVQIAAKYDSNTGGKIDITVIQ